MIKLSTIRNYIVIKNRFELKEAMEIDLCRYIILEDNNVIYIWTNDNGKWTKTTYVAFDNGKEKDFETSGRDAYQSFYYYCGREEVEKMKHILTPIPIWESYEQLHYANINYISEKLYQSIYVFDANSAFTYGVMQLPEGFNKLKEYMSELYEKKKSASNKITRSRYKNLQNYLIGYFARVKDFVSLRSEIIKNSNENILKCMGEINKVGGTVYISNTDSIITNEKGAAVMVKYIGDEVGQFKLEKTANRLFYKSSNIYQLDNKVTYSGVGYFARKHIDFFDEKYATEKGNLIEAFDFLIEAEAKEYIKVCRVKFGKIEVSVVNKIGELINTYIYKIGA